MALTQYLDTYPTDEKAFKQYNEKKEKRKDYKMQVEEQLESFSKTEPYVSGKTAGWDSGPWPWQL